MTAVRVGHYFPCDSCDISSKWGIISASGRFSSTVISTHIKVLNYIMQKFILPTFSKNNLRLWSFSTNSTEVRKVQPLSLLLAMLFRASVLKHASLETSPL